MEVAPGACGADMAPVSVWTLALCTDISQNVSVYQGKGETGMAGRVNKGTPPEPGPAAPEPKENPPLLAGEGA